MFRIMSCGRSEALGRWAEIAPSIEHVRLNTVAPLTYLCETLTKTARGHASHKIDDYLLWDR